MHLCMFVTKAKMLHAHLSKISLLLKPGNYLIRTGGNIAAALITEI